MMRFTHLHRSLLPLLIFFACAVPLHAQESTSIYGVESIESDFFVERYQSNDLVHYLDNLNLHVTYQAETTGQFNQPDRLLFSVDGSSYRWNHYYLEGFRIDSRYFSGSTFYTPDMYDNSMKLDYIGSSLYFEPQRRGGNAISASYNVGGVGGISPGTEWAIHLFHDTATDRSYKTIEERNHIVGAGTFASSFVVEKDGREYYHSQYVDFGARDIVDFDNTGISGSYTESYFSAQAMGDLSWRLGSLFDSTHYLANYSQRSNLNSEFYYGEAETAAYSGYSASLYGRGKRGEASYTSGVTFAQHNTRHEDINFSRNLYDQDGEAFEPYAPDGNNFELSHSLFFERPLNEWLTLSFDGFNSLLYAAPTTTSFENSIYIQGITDTFPTPLYTYCWSASNYASGLLENSLKLSAVRHPSQSVTLRADLATTLDAMLLGGGKSKVSPNVELQVGVAYEPNDWFSTEVTVARRRVSYSIEDLQYFSDDYLNGDIYYAGSGDYFTSTGGSLHTLDSAAQQPAYWVFDFPVNFTFGRHRISLLQSARKYVHNWVTSYDASYDEYGYYVTDENSGLDIFYLNSGATPSYVVGEYAEGSMGSSFLTDTPFYFSSNVQYSYTTPKFFFSFAWQSYMQSGFSTLGNGPLHNNLGVLSESSANPNTWLNTGNAESDYKAVGRLDQERAYILRGFASYNFSEKLALAVNLKFKDGQPFSFFESSISTDSAGNEQVAIYPSTTRGINTVDGDFGTREDAFFNIDVRVTYRTMLARRLCEMQLGIYNIYDFGTELTEYTFDQDLDRTRYAMSLNIPRGLTFSIKYHL
ncbi:MAG: hypothetical protein SNI45_07490 [Rikenellaceae bacterium]